jgi:conjugal transfer/type IV secretion protein DotA/TraY
MKCFATGLALWATSISVSNAAEIDIADIVTGEGDSRSNSFLNMIFGPLFTGPNDETLISSLIANFNVLFFAVGCVLIVYNIVVGVTETAHEGEVLGRQHSSLWVPLRTVLAAAALIPMPTGYNGIQHAVAYAVNVGTATSSFFWDQSVDLIVDQKMPVSGADYDTLDGQFLQALWRMELCQAVYNMEVAKGGNGLEGVSRSWSQKSGVTEMHYSLPNSYGACGTVSLPPETNGFDRLAEAAGKTYSDYVSSMKQAVDETANSYSQTAAEVAQAVSKRTAAPAFRNLRADLEAWRNRHSAILRTYINTEQLNQTGKAIAEEELSLNVTPVGDASAVTLSGSLKNGGWLQAGFYYQLISRMTADSSSLATAMPTAAPGGAIGAASSPNGQVRNAIASQYAANNWYLFGSADGDASKFLQQIASTYNGAVEWWNQSVAQSGIRSFVNERAAFVDGGGEISDWMPSAGSLYTVLETFNPVAGMSDPMVGLVSLGAYLQVFVVSVTVALSLFAIIPYVGTGVSVFVGLFGALITTLGVVGAFLTFILPMLPTVIWVIGVSSFFLLVVEAIFAAPLWAIAHLSLEGRGMSGQQARRGYVLILGLILTPVLMLFGLFIGMILFRITGTLFNGGIYYAISSSQSLIGDSAISLVWYFGVVVIMVFVAFVYFIIIERSFSMISEFPSRVFRWFDSIANDLDDKAMAKVNASGFATTGALGAPIQGGVKAIADMGNRPSNRLPPPQGPTGQR